MSIDKHHNFDSDGGSPNLPNATGDRYYAQDLSRDFWFLLSSSGKVLKDLFGVSKLIISGGVVTHPAGQKKIDLDSFNGYAPYSVTIPDSWSSLPPTTKSDDVALANIIAPNVLGFDLTTQPVPATCNGSTMNYIKIAYTETDLNSRSKVHGIGSYYSERVIGYVLSVNTVPPTNYEICLGQLKCSSDGNTMVINSDYRDYDLVRDKKILVFTASGTWRNKLSLTRARVTCVGKGGDGGDGGSSVPLGIRGLGGGGGGAGEVKSCVVAGISGDVSVVIDSSSTGFGGFLSAIAGTDGETGGDDGHDTRGGQGGSGGVNGGGGGGFATASGGAGGTYWNKGKDGSDYGGGTGGDGGSVTLGAVPFTGGNGGASGSGGGGYGGGGGGGGGAGYAGDGGAGGAGGAQDRIGLAGTNGSGYGAGGGGGGGCGYQNASAGVGGEGGLGGGGICIVEVLD